MPRSFEGPLFIVGMSRSGTKLLRDVLNKNKDVAIPPYESHCLPYLVKKFSTVDWPLGEDDKNELRNLVESSTFYNDIKRTDKNFEPIDFDKLANQKDIQASIKYLMTTLAPRDNGGRARVWGDKTPNNMLHIVLLKNAFPEAKFIHIIRDPRERALSTSKAWNASLQMSAERWRNGVATAREQGRAIGPDYIEVTYESLVESPEEVIKNLCSFLGIKYSKSMLNLDKPAENYRTANNSTKSAQTIVSGNVSKFKTQLSQGKIRKIEMICGELAVQLGYVDSQAGDGYRLGIIKKAILKSWDKLMTVRFHIGRWGLLKGIKYLLWRKKVTNI